MTDTTEKVFVYHYRFREWTGEALVEGSGKVTRERLNEWLKANPGFQSTTKQVTSRYPEIYQRDLLTEAQIKASEEVALNQQRASCKFPTLDYVRGKREMVIVSKKNCVWD